MPRQIVSVNEDSLKDDLKILVRTTIQETLNALLDEEADSLAGAERYERSADRDAYRSGHYKRKLTTTSGEVELAVPKLRGATFQTAVIERYRRRETSVEEAMMEMYLAGVSTRRIEDVSEILWGSTVSAATVSNLNEKAFAQVEKWRTRELSGAYPYVYIDGIYLKRAWGGSYQNIAVMIAIGVNAQGYREIIGCAEGYTESKDAWVEFLEWSAPDLWSTFNVSSNHIQQLPSSLRLKLPPLSRYLYESSSFPSLAGCYSSEEPVAFLQANYVDR